MNTKPVQANKSENNIDSTVSYITALIVKYEVAGTKIPAFHPAANLLPEMSQVAFQELIEDIRKTGHLIHPVVMCAGQILAGRHRYLGCLEAGITPTTVEWDGHGDPVDYIISVDLARRQLNDDQRACVAVKISEYLAAQSKQTRAQKATAVRHNIETVDSSEVPGASKERARTKAAAQLNVAESRVRKAQDLKKAAPALFQEVADGQMRLPQARAKAKRKEEDSNPKTTTITPPDSKVTAPVAPQSSVNIEKLFVAFSERTYIELNLLNAQRAGQPLATATCKKLSTLAKLIKTITTTKEDSNDNTR